MERKLFLALPPMLFLVLTACGGGGGGGNALNAGDPTYLPVGPQSSVPAATVSAGGWTACHTELYSSASAVPLTTVLADCPKAKLMMACRPVGSATYTLLAQAPRADVTFATPADAATVHVANGTAWYYNTAWSWGFALGGDTVNKSSCDSRFGAAETNSSLRLCWHTGGGNMNSGYRCGVNETLNGSATWEKIVLQPK